MYCKDFHIVHFCMQQVKSKSHIFSNFAGQDVFELENIISVAKCILVTLILLFLEI